MFPYAVTGNGNSLHGHFNANYKKAIGKRFESIYLETLDRLGGLCGNIGGENAKRYFFYKSVSISFEAIILFSKRYSAECRRQAYITYNPVRKKRA